MAATLLFPLGNKLKRVFVSHRQRGSLIKQHLLNRRSLVGSSAQLDSNNHTFFKGFCDAIWGIGANEKQWFRFKKARLYIDTNKCLYIQHNSFKMCYFVYF